MVEEGEEMLHEGDLRDDEGTVCGPTISEMYEDKDSRKNEFLGGIVLEVWLARERRPLRMIWPVGGGASCVRC